MSLLEINRLILLSDFFWNRAPAKVAAAAKLPPGGRFCRVIYVALTIEGDAADNICEN